MGNGNAEEGIEIQNESFIYGHQLADQYCGMLCGKWNISQDIYKELIRAGRKNLIYITAHYEMPKADILDAVINIEKRGCQEKHVNCWVNAESNIFWVGWRLQLCHLWFQCKDRAESSCYRSCPY